jgi:hypothetical protein
MNYILLIQTFISAVKAVEQLMPASKGKEKLDACIAIVEQIFGDVQPLVPVLTAIATSTVTALRAMGVFKAKTAAAA